MSVPDIRKKVHELCLKALDGKLSSNDLRTQWPQAANESPFLKQVYEDLNDGIRHLPRSWFKKGIDVEIWRDQLEYNPILLDSTLLTSNKSDEEMLKFRIETLNDEYPDVKLANLKKQRLKNKKRLIYGAALVFCFFGYLSYWWNQEIKDLHAEMRVTNGIPFYYFYLKNSRWPEDMNEIQDFIKNNKDKPKLDFTNYKYQSFYEMPNNNLKIVIVKTKPINPSNGEFKIETELSRPKPTQTPSPNP